jgi:PKHD-type hydroxylase
MIFPIPPTNTFGKEDIVYWEGFLTNEELNYLTNVNNWSDLSPAYVGGSDLGQSIYNKNVRSTKVSWLSINDENKHIWNKITKTIAEVNSRFFHYDLTGCYEPMQLGIYTADEKGHYDWHTDASVHDRNPPRKLSMVLMLSDSSEYQGGQLQVKPLSDNFMTLDQAKGRAWFFPSYVLHRVTPVTRGTRKTIVLWVGGPPFK